MARRRIALLGGHGGRSGVPRHLHQLCNLLRDSADITLFTDINEGGYDFAADLGIKHVVVNGLSTSLNPVRLRRVWRDFCAELDARDPYDILWAHARLSLPLARRYVRRKPTTTRLIATYHGSPFAGRSQGQSATMRSLEKRALARTPPHDLVFLSQSDLDTFHGLPLDSHRVHVIANCSDLGALPDPDPPQHPTLVMTTRAARQKNLAAAARIFRALPDDYRLVLRGHGTDTFVRSQFQRLLKPDVCDRITFGATINDVRPDLRRADAYLLTSRYEGLSIGALEAFEAGLPVAMPQIGGAHELQTHHPQCAIIDPKSPQVAATDVHALVTGFRADRTRHIAQNHDAWSRAFHPALWATKINGLLSPQGHS